MNIKEKLLISSLAIIAAGTSYLAIIKYNELNNDVHHHKNFVQEKLILIHDDLQNLLTKHDEKKEENNNEEPVAKQSEKANLNEIIEINTQDDLRAMFKENNNPSVIFFHMDGCGWCNKMKPIFEQAAKNKQFARLQFYNINGKAAQAPVVVKELFNQSISGYPFFLFINEHAMVDNQSGFSDQEKFENKVKNSFAQLII